MIKTKSRCPLISPTQYCTEASHQDNWARKIKKGKTWKKAKLYSKLAILLFLRNLPPPLGPQGDLE